MYLIYRESEDLFSMDEVELARGRFVFGNYDRIRFDGARIVISQIVFDNEYDSGVIKIRDSYVDNIKYDEELSQKECSEGICPTYHGTMYFINPEGKRHDYAFEKEVRSATDVRLPMNPVRLVYINDSVMLITDCDDDALMYRSYYDKNYDKQIYHITDHQENQYDKGHRGTVDLLRYRKEKI